MIKSPSLSASAAASSKAKLTVKVPSKAKGDPAICTLPLSVAIIPGILETVICLEAYTPSWSFAINISVRPRTVVSASFVISRITSGFTVTAVRAIG